MKALLIPSLFILCASVYAESTSLSAVDTETESFRAAIGVARNTAALENSDISYSNEYSASTYEAEGFDAWALTGEVKRQTSLDWFNQFWFWDLSLSISEKNKSTLDSGLCLVQNQFTEGTYDVDCDVVMEEQVHSLNSTLLTLHKLNSDWYANYGFGVGIYNIRRELRVKASGYDSKELERISNYALAPHIKLGVGFKRVELSYTLAPGIGDDDLGEGAFHQINLSYGSWQKHPVKE